MLGLARRGDGVGVTRASNWPQLRTQNTSLRTAHKCLLFPAHRLYEVTCPFCEIADKRKRAFDL